MPLGPELQMMVDWDEACTAFIDAKKNRDKDPAGYAKAKAAMQSMRTYWREIDTLVGVRSRGGPGVARTATIAATAEVKKV